MEKIKRFLARPKPSIIKSDNGFTRFCSNWFIDFRKQNRINFNRTSPTYHTHPVTNGAAKHFSLSFAVSLSLSLFFVWIYCPRKMTYWLWTVFSSTLHPFPNLTHPYDRRSIKPWHLSLSSPRLFAASPEQRDERQRHQNRAERQHRSGGDTAGGGLLTRDIQQHEPGDGAVPAPPDDDCVAGHVAALVAGAAAGHDSMIQLDVG